MRNHPLARSESARRDYGEYHGTKDYPHSVVSDHRGLPFTQLAKEELSSWLSIIDASHRWDQWRYNEEHGYPQPHAVRYYARQTALRFDPFGGETVAELEARLDAIIARINA